MPIYEYRCECGKTLDVLVRGGREPQSCDESRDRSLDCAGNGRLSRMLSAAAVGRSGGGSKTSEPALCGACGSIPGSCES